MTQMLGQVLSFRVEQRDETLLDTAAFEGRAQPSKRGTQVGQLSLVTRRRPDQWMGGEERRDQEVVVLPPRRHMLANERHDVGKHLSHPIGRLSKATAQSS